MSEQADPLLAEFIAAFRALGMEKVGDVEKPTTPSRKAFVCGYLANVLTDLNGAAPTRPQRRAVRACLALAKANGWNFLEWTKAHPWVQALEAT